MKPSAYLLIPYTPSVYVWVNKSRKKSGHACRVEDFEVISFSIPRRQFRKVHERGMSHSTAPTPYVRTINLISNELQVGEVKGVPKTTIRK